MKNLIGVIPLLLLFCSVVSASEYNIHGGETISFEIDRCTFLDIKINPYEPDEWHINTDCVEGQVGHFVCECEDSFILDLTPAINSVGEFDIEITNIYYTEEEQKPVLFGGGTYSCEALGWRCVNNNSCCSGLICVDNKCAKENVTGPMPVNITVDVPDGDDVIIDDSGGGSPPLIEDEEEPERHYDYRLTISGIILLTTLGLLYWRKRKKRQKPLAQKLG